MRKLYLLSVYDNHGERFYKIGFTKKSVESRVKQLQTGNYSKIEIDYVYESDDYIVSIESRLHKHFDSKRISGEWFDLDREDIKEFPTLCERFHEMFKSLEDNTYLEDRGRTFK